ncbi:hypothetical protein UFOVP181_261 [uncultured Caudovirales phage]|uniref:Uncharacterized protein n=1 Tax=uncultured Caudovirales phage TaxID=2100421 RepID=A0A6J5KYA8_9CAUD|nr:hypothetical protein UFOVP57_378 [uncultured Caudovirales phage]CAB5208950.1 hypothetical protein UFOVP181_261 [uncultured Caudovirales phage]
MKSLLILLTAVVLTGCVNVPVARHFPEVPAELLVACPDLKLIDPNTTKLSEVVEIVAENYGQYNECQIKVDGWIEWYKTQKDIFDSVK